MTLIKYLYETITMADSYIKGTVKTIDNNNVYIKNYYSNGKVIKFTITKHQDENMSFSGTVIGNDKSIGQSPNYNPLMRIRQILKNIKELKYLKYKNILIEEIFDNNVTIVNTYPLPTTSYRFTKIKNGTRIIVTDEINNKMINLIYE